MAAHAVVVDEGQFAGEAGGELAGVQAGVALTSAVVPWVSSSARTSARSPSGFSGGGTSQAGQTVNTGVVVDFSKHLNGVRSLDVEGRRAVVELSRELGMDRKGRQIRGFLRNPADDHTLKVFDPAVRGTTDQFVYKFRKPRGD